MGESTNKKTDKELAFLQDLFIAPDWGERFAELIDEHVKPPTEGKALYIAAGTGGHARALQERAGSKLDLLCVDENPECLELAPFYDYGRAWNTVGRTPAPVDLSSVGAQEPPHRRDGGQPYLERFCFQHLPQYRGANRLALDDGGEANDLHPSAQGAA